MTDFFNSGFMEKRKIAFYIRSLNDKVVFIGKTRYNKESIKQLVEQSGGEFWIQSGSDGIPDLCTHAESHFRDDIVGVFNDGKGNYELHAQDFFGGHPHDRPKPNH